MSRKKSSNKKIIFWIAILSFLLSMASITTIIIRWFLIEPKSSLDSISHFFTLDLENWFDYAVTLSFYIFTIIFLFFLFIFSLPQISKKPQRKTFKKHTFQTKEIAKSSKPVKNFIKETSENQYEDPGIEPQPVKSNNVLKNIKDVQNTTNSSNNFFRTQQMQFNDIQQKPETPQPLQTQQFQQMPQSSNDVTNEINALKYQIDQKSRLSNEEINRTNAIILEKDRLQKQLAQELEQARMLQSSKQDKILKSIKIAEDEARSFKTQADENLRHTLEMAQLSHQESLRAVDELKKNRISEIAQDQSLFDPQIENLKKAAQAKIDQLENEKNQLMNLRNNRISSAQSQLESISQALDRHLQVSDLSNRNRQFLVRLSIEQLKLLAQENGISLLGITKKSELVEALRYIDPTKSNSLNTLVIIEDMKRKLHSDVIIKQNLNQQLLEKENWLEQENQKIRDDFEVKIANINYRQKSILDLQAPLQKNQFQKDLSDDKLKVILERIKRVLE